MASVGTAEVYDEGAHTGDPERDLAYEREQAGTNYGSSSQPPLPPSSTSDPRLPDDVVEYLRYFKRMVEEQNVHEIHSLYEHGFPELTDRFFREKLWPNDKKVEAVCGNDNRLFLILYKEMYFRHVYMKMQRGPSLSHRYDSYMNYQDLFFEILNAKEEPLTMQLPNIWLWDTIDEFVYQFQSFCLYKANPGKRNSEELEDLIQIENNQHIWNIYPVLNILYSLIEKSQINEQLMAINSGRNPDDVADDFGRHPLYFKLGYFSLIGLLRTHVLLGDYFQALKTVENLEIDPKGLYNTVPSCLVTLHYFVGFSHMMMRNYGEATKIFVNCLMYIQRTKNLQQQHHQAKKNPWQYDVIGKSNDQLYHLLAICLTIQPQRIDEAVHSQLQEKTGDRMSRMAKGDLDEFKQAFQQGCPKFLSPTTAVFEGGNLSKEPLMRQCAAFLEGIESQISIPILRGYLKLYTTLPMKKLATFMDVSEDDYDSFVGKLLSFKHIVSELGKEGETNAEDDTTADLDFYIDKDMICIADTKVARRVGEYFIKHIQKLQEVNRNLRRLPVGPAPPKTIHRVQQTGR